MTSTSLPDHRAQWIDNLRGIAALLVVFLHLWWSIPIYFHVDPNGPIKVTGYFVYDLWDLGKIGVVIFFFISGYVVPYSFKGRSSKIFLINRFFRLYPAYWISILSFIIVSGVPPLKDLLLNVTMFQKFFGAPDLIAAFWTLQIELIFYVICAILHYFKLLQRDKFIIRALVFLISATFLISFLRFATEKKLPVAMFLGLMVMFLGLSWRRYTLDRSVLINKKFMMRALAVFVITLLPVTLLAYSKDYGTNEAWYRYFFSYVISTVIFCVSSHYKFVTKLLTYFGSISYSLYLLHAVFGLDLAIIVVRYFNIYNIFAYIIAFFLLSISSATLCYFAIERPCIILGKKMILKYNIGGDKFNKKNNAL